MLDFFGRLGENLGFPINASSHGLIIDHMNGWIHWLMLILFIGWSIFLMRVNNLNIMYQIKF